jgi:thymidylate kinase
MRLILAGCEYSGTTTLAHAIDDWLYEMMGARFPLIHDHWKIPHTSGHPSSDMTDEEQRQVLTLSPKLKEMTQRHSLYYHIQPASWRSPDYMAVGLHIDDTVYSPLYFGYGGQGDAHDRKVVSQQVERAILEFAPDITLVLVKASPDVIRRRMKGSPHPNGVLKDKDVEYVLQEFDEAYRRSLLRHKISIDGSATVEAMVAEFAGKIEPHLTDTDRLRILTHRSWQKG